jgi:hypothetical protein
LRAREKDLRSYPFQCCFTAGGSGSDKQLT